MYLPISFTGTLEMSTQNGSLEIQRELHDRISLIDHSSVNVVYAVFAPNAIPDASSLFPNHHVLVTSNNGNVGVGFWTPVQV